MQFPTARFRAPRSIAPSKENWKKKKKGEKARYGAETFHMTNRDITPRRKMNSPPVFARKLRTKGSILFSLSRNGPIRPTWFHSKKPLQNYFNFFRQRSLLPGAPKISSDISPGFGILHGPLYLTLLRAPPSLSLSFTPRPRISLAIESREPARLLFDNTSSPAYERRIVVNI